MVGRTFWRADKGVLYRGKTIQMGAPGFCCFRSYLAFFFEFEEDSVELVDRKESKFGSLFHQSSALSGGQVVSSFVCCMKTLIFLIYTQGRIRLVRW